MHLTADTVGDNVGDKNAKDAENFDAHQLIMTANAKRRNPLLNGEQKDDPHVLQPSGPEPRFRNSVADSCCQRAGSQFVGLR